MVLVGRGNRAQSQAVENMHVGPEFPIDKSLSCVALRQAFWPITSMPTITPFYTNPICLHYFPIPLCTAWSSICPDVLVLASSTSGHSFQILTTVCVKNVSLTPPLSLTLSLETYPLLFQEWRRTATMGKRYWALTLPLPFIIFYRCICVQ